MERTLTSLEIAAADLGFLTTCSLTLRVSRYHQGGCQPPISTYSFLAGVKLGHTDPDSVRLFRGATHRSFHVRLTRCRALSFEIPRRNRWRLKSAQHRSNWQVRHGTTRLPQHALGGGPAQAVEEFVRTIGRHHDQIRESLKGGLQDDLSGCRS